MDGGFWATVYRCPISFTILAPAAARVNPSGPGRR
jgi:hypothetical protein